MATQIPTRQPIEVFIAFSPVDQKYLSKLETSLAVLKRNHLISIRNIKNIEAGKESASEVSHFINTASLILLLLSPEFLDSEYCYSADLLGALRRHASGKAQLIPIIVRPCDWKNTEFGDIPVLPDDAKPINKWHPQDEAFNNITKHIRSIIGEGGEVSALKPALHFKREIPRLLTYLCNRREQEKKLSDIFSAEHISPHRPFVCIIHGNDDEGHDMYKSRLQHSSLPRLLPGGLPGKFSTANIYLDFPHSVHTVEAGFSSVRSDLAERVTFNKKASNEEIAESLSQYRTPVMIHSYLKTVSWTPHGQGLVDAIINYWNVFPNLSPTTHLIVCLFVIYTKAGVASAQGGPAMAERQGVENILRARDYLNKLDFTRYSGLRGAVLPEMLPVPLTEAENYFRDDRNFSKICKIHSYSFCNSPGAVEEIRSYYKSVDSKNPNPQVPMQLLTKELERVIEKNLC